MTAVKIRRRWRANLQEWWRAPAGSSPIRCPDGVVRWGFPPRYLTLGETPFVASSYEIMFKRDPVLWDRDRPGSGRAVWGKRAPWTPNGMPDFTRPVYRPSEVGERSEAEAEAAS